MFLGMYEIQWVQLIAFVLIVWFLVFRIYTDWSLKRRLFLAFAVVFVSLSFKVNYNFYTMANDDEQIYHPWPGVTMCDMCDQRIYVWDDYERRNYKVRGGKVETDEISISIGMSGLVHTAHEGVPEMDAPNVQIIPGTP